MAAISVVDKVLRSVAPRAYAARVDARSAADVADARAARMDLLLERDRSEALREMEQNRIIGEIDKTLTRAYDAAVYNPATPFSAYSQADANEMIVGAVGTVRALMHDALRNDELVMEAVDAGVDIIHGGGIHPRADVERHSEDRNEQVNSLVMERYYDYFESLEIDVYGQSTWVDLINLGLRGERGADGEFLFIQRWHTLDEVERRGLQHPMKLEPIGPQWLADQVKVFTYRNKEYPVVGGVVVDPATKLPFGYLFYTEKGATGAPGGAYKFVDARLVIHYFDVKVAGQRRGISPLAASVYTFRDIRNLHKMGQDRMMASTALMLVLGVKANAGPGSSSLGEYNPLGGGGEAGSARRGDNLPRDARLRDMHGGVVERLGPNQVARVAEGTEVTQVTPPNADGMMDVYKMGLRRIATAAGVSYPQISKDYGDGNFVSLRMEATPIMRRAKRRRWNMVERVHKRVFQDWVTGCYTMAAWQARGRLQGWKPYFTYDEFRWNEVEWIEPLDDSYDPKADAETRRLDLETGVIDHTDIWRSRGLDPKQQIKKMASTKKYAMGQGIDLDKYIWPRNNANPAANQAQKQEATNAD